MPITEATIQVAKYFPERLPESVLRTTVLNTETAAILNLRRFPPRMVQLDTLACVANANIDVRIRADGIRRSDIITTALPGIAIPARYTMTAKDFLWMTLFARAVVANYPLWCSMWVWQPTVADKLKFGIALTPEEERIDRDLGIRSSVEKGILPAPFSYILERHFQVINEETIAWNGTAAVAGTEVSRMVPNNPDEFLVLVAITSTGTAAASDVHLVIDRDDNAAYIDMLCNPLAIAYEVPCFIPALRELIVRLTAGIAVVGMDVRFTFRRCKMTNIIRARYKLVPRDELPEPEIWDKVWGGIV